MNCDLKPLFVDCALSAQVTTDTLINLTTLDIHFGPPVILNIRSLGKCFVTVPLCSLVTVATWIKILKLLQFRNRNWNFPFSGKFCEWQVILINFWRKKNLTKYPHAFRSIECLNIRKLFYSRNFALIFPQ